MTNEFGAAPKKPKFAVLGDRILERAFTPLQELQQQIADGLKATTPNGRKELQERKLAAATSPGVRMLMERIALIDENLTAYYGQAPSVDAMAIVAALMTKGTK